MALKIPYAVCSSANTIGFPQSAERTKDWRCPSCKAPVCVKRGNVKVAHFAHKQGISRCSGGESLNHKATKEWIAANVSSSDFRITATCAACSRNFTAWRGSGSYTGATEMEFRTCGKTYRVDAVAISGNQAAAAIEVYHTHATGPTKMAALLSVTNAFEVHSVDLVKEKYPMEFESCRPLRCPVCVSRARKYRKLNSETRRYQRAVSAGSRWLSWAKARTRARLLRVARRWMLLARVSKVAAKARNLHAAEEALRFKACAKCQLPIELWRWRYDRNSRLWTTVRLEYAGPGDDNKVYHSKCSPWCEKCGEVHTGGKWCACVRATKRKCVDCGTWSDKDKMYSYENPPHADFYQSWVCDGCARECRQCGAWISKIQAKYGGRCYSCNTNRKRQCTEW